MFAAEATDTAGWILVVQWAWIVLFFGPWIYALVHVFRHTESEFRRVDSSKTLWVVLLLLVSIFAAVPYLFTVRRRLNRLEADAPTKVAQG